MWVDEWKNNVNDQLAEMFKSNADGSVKLVGTLDEFTATSRQHRTGLVISGEFRAIDTALNQRYVMVPLQKNEDDKKLESAREASALLSAYTIRILQEYEEWWTALNAAFKAVRGKWLKLLTGKIDIRIIENYAKVYVFRFSVKWRGALSVSEYSALRGGDFQGIRVYRSDVFWEERERRTSAPATSSR